MANNAKILIIDDEAAIRKLLEITLQSSGYETVVAGNCKDGLLMAATSAPDLILLDLGLPDGDGQDVLLQLRDWFSRPVIILSVKDSEAEIVKALDHGANDYLTKPFRTQELLARIRTALRFGAQADSEPVKTFGDLSIDFAARTVKSSTEILKLTPTEYQLLSLLAKNEGRVLTHHYLLKEVWGNAYSGQTQYLRVFVGQLRKKIEHDANRPQYILTESGIGYRFSSS